MMNLAVRYAHLQPPSIDDLQEDAMRAIGESFLSKSKQFLSAANKVRVGVRFASSALAVKSSTQEDPKYYDDGRHRVPLPRNASLDFKVEDRSWDSQSSMDKGDALGASDGLH